MLDTLGPTRILIIAPNAALSGYCSLAFKAELKCEIYECHTLEVLSKQLELTLKHDMLVFVRCPELHSFYLSNFSTYKVSLVLSIEENQKSHKTIKNFISENKHQVAVKKYISIHRNLILFHGYTPVDIYICLSDNKITRFLPAASVIHQKDFGNLIELGLDDFYILSSDISSFQTYSKKKIETHLLEISLQSQQVFDVFTEYKNALGPKFRNINKELLDEFDIYFISALKLCFTDPLLKKNIKDRLSDNVYFPIHMYMVGFLCSRLAYLSGLQTTTTNTLFAFASIIHDLALVTENENEVEMIKKLDCGEFDTSPFTSSDLLHHGEHILNRICSIESLPDWVHDILLKHHERPDGAGFPTGEDPKNFTIHTSIFIIAHMIFDDIYHSSSQTSITEILQQFPVSNFNKGSINKVAQKVRELKIIVD